MKNVTLLVIALVICWSCAQESTDNERSVGAQEYEIIGNVTGFDDSTMLVLSKNNVDIDSTLIIDGQFKFSGAIDQPMSVFLATKPLMVFTAFWIEPGTITINGSFENFSNVEVIGGPIQKDNAAFNAILNKIDLEIDSMETLGAKVMSGKIEMTEADKKQFMQVYDSLGKASDLAHFKFIEENPSAYLSVHLLNFYSTTWGKDKVVSLFEGLSNEMKTNSEGEEIVRFLELSADVGAGEKFTDFESTLANGGKMKLSDIKDKYVLLEFWASWCGPCRADNPELVSTYNEFKDKGFEILGVALDNNESNWKQAIADDGLPWPNVSDLEGSEGDAAFIYGVSAIPDNFLIAPDGTIIERDLRGQELKNKLNEIFAND